MAQVCIRSFALHFLGCIRHNARIAIKANISPQIPSTNLIDTWREHKNGNTWFGEVLFKFMLGLYGTGNFEKNRDRESPGPEKPGSGPGLKFLTGTGTGNREKSGIFRNNFFTQKFYYSNYFLKKSVQFSNYFILGLDLFFWIKKTENF